MTTCCSSSDQATNRIDPPITIGSSRAFNVLVVDEDGQPYDLTGAKGYMTARRRVEDAQALIKKKTLNAGGSDYEFLFLNQTTDKGYGRFFILPTDTQSLDPTLTLKYDVWVVLSTGERKDVVQVSDMPLRSSVTRDF